MKIFFIFLFAIFLCSCSSVTHTFKYGYLLGSDFEYYAPISKVDLKGKKYRLELIDNRLGNTISCYNYPVPRDTELENKAGLNYFENYIKAMVDFNNGRIDPSANESIKIILNAISGDLKMAVYGHAYGFVEFDTSVGNNNKKYCSAMIDGDEDAPLGKFSFDTRKGAFRKLVSGSTRRSLEQFMHDLAKY